MEPDMTETNHPDPTAWWRHRRAGHYCGIVGLAALAVGVFAFGVPDCGGSGDSILEYVALGCVLLIVGYGPGSTLVDAVAAWRGTQ